MAGLGEEIFRTHDEYGAVLVHQQGNRRTLTFGTRVEQSALLLEDPARLEYTYTQAMILALLLVERVQHAVVLGLGGGSLLRALRDQLPRARILGVEQRKGVIEAARACFFLIEDQRLTLNLADATEFVRHRANQADLLFADLYGPDGMDGRQIGADFLADCHAMLRPGGVFVANLWDSEYRQSAEANRRLKAAFDGRVLFNHVQGGNIIAYGFAGELPRLERRRFFTRAQVLGNALRIPLQRLARSLWRQNAELLQLGRYAVTAR
jgi:spermidine synthase